MSLTYLFRWMVVAQVLLGIVTFCMAEQNPTMLLVAGAIGALSWYVVEGPSGQPLARWLTNVVGPIAAVVWLLFDLYWQKGNVIIAMGHFTMWLQILELYARKTNRDYGLILVLSLLQMIGATILSMSVIFGMLLVAYCVLALLTVLLFQLKSTSDLVLGQNQAAAPAGTQVSRPEVLTTRGYRGQFRVMAIVIGVLSALIGVVVFLLIPRTSRFTSTNELINPPMAEVGFSPRVHLDGAGSESNNPQPVANLKINLVGDNIGSDHRSWLLRGAALDHYNNLTHTWDRGPHVRNSDVTYDLPEHGRQIADVTQALTLEAEITLRRTRDRSLFTLHPISHVATPNLDSIVFNPFDQRLLVPVGERVVGSITYTVQKPLRPAAEIFASYGKDIIPLKPPPPNYARRWNTQTPKIARYAQQILGQAGLPRRNPEKTHDPNDEKIVGILTLTLQRDFKYTLTNPGARADQDPIVEFLFVQKQGHCELFASALAAMCRSIGIGARVITGYRASEFNRIGGYYVIRQNNAHAWCEIDLGDQGWQTFDATPPADVEAEHRVKRSWLTSAGELYEYFEFVWISSVISYDKETRRAMLTGINRSIRDLSSDQDKSLGKVVVWAKGIWNEWRFNLISFAFIVFISFFILVGSASLLHRYLVRRRRLGGLQLNRLPHWQRRGLARRLGFYLDMLDMLERRGHRRPHWQSPFGFAQDLATQNPLRFDPVLDLTELFYEIRFGHRPLDKDRKGRIRALLKRLERTLVET